MELNFEAMFTLGTALCTVVAAFIVVKQKVGEVEKSIEHLFRKCSATDSSLDKNNLKTEAMTRELDRLQDINSPSNLMKKNREMAKFEAKFEAIESQQLPHIDRRLLKLEGLHNGEHR